MEIRVKYCFSMTKKENKETTPESKAQKVASRSYTPISDALSEPNVLADNEFSESFSRFKIPRSSNNVSVKIDALIP